MPKQRKHGEGSVQEYRPGRFRIRYTTRDGERRAKAGFLSEKAANKALRDILTDIDRDEYFDERKGETLFKDFAAEYLELKKGDVSEGSFRNWKSLLNTTLLPTFGNKKLNEITDGLVEVWWSRNAHKKVNRRNAFFLASPLMKKAVKRRYIRMNPFDVIEEPGAKAHKDRPTWEPDDLRTVLDAAPNFVVPMLWVKFAAHLRIGELSGLNRSDYEIKTGNLRIERQNSDIGGRHLKETKTGNRRTIELLGPGRRALDTYLAAHPMLPNAPLFTGPKGGRVSPATVRKAWLKACEATGVDNFHMHDIKAISLTVYGQTGADTRDIMARGGHTSYAAALTYQRTSASRDAELTAKANKRLEAMGL